MTSLLRVRWLFVSGLILSLGACSRDSTSDDGGVGGGNLGSGGSSSGGSGASDGSGGEASGGRSSAGGSASGGQGGEVGGDGGGGLGGEGPDGGSGGLDASGGSGETGGSGGALEGCAFDISATLSPDILTVGVVEWSTGLTGLTEARIDFSLNAPEPGEVNVGSGGPIATDGSTALLLGMKPERSYTYRITATAGETVCVSPEQTLTTEALARTASLTREPGEAVEARERGFIVTCSADSAFIVDADGDVVWWARGAGGCVRAHMDWEGQHMWTMSLNGATGSASGGSSGRVARMHMDGSGLQNLLGFDRAHHDFAVLPGGTAAFLVVADGVDDTEIVERSPDGQISTVVRLNADAYLQDTDSYHPNALRYWARDDSYTVSDLNAYAIAKFNREGETQWQMSNSCSGAPSAKCATADLAGTHGHHLMDNGNLVFFAAGIGNPTGPTVNEYSFEDAGGTLTAQLEWSYEDSDSSLILGDVQRLENGNTLITYSATRIIREVTPAGAVVQSLIFGGVQLGYALFRETLYGPPQ